MVSFTVNLLFCFNALSFSAIEVEVVVKEPSE
jgi:hypothetical protein